MRRHLGVKRMCRRSAALAFYHTLTPPSLSREERGTELRWGHILRALRAYVLMHRAQVERCTAAHLPYGPVFWCACPSGQSLEAWGLMREDADRSPYFGTISSLVSADT
jgi:hypothetical protein